MTPEQIEEKINYLNTSIIPNFVENFVLLNLCFMFKQNQHTYTLKLEKVLSKRNRKKVKADKS